MWPFTSKPKPIIRSTVDGATVDALLSTALRDRKSAYCRHIPTKDTTSVITMADVEAAAKRAYRPWLKGAWECEQQAIEVVQEAQKAAANEGRSWAVGILRAFAPPGVDGLHVYVFAIVHSKSAMFSGREVVFYDPTNKRRIDAESLHVVDFTLY